MTNRYKKIQILSERLSKMAKRYNVAIVTATQNNTSDSNAPYKPVRRSADRNIVYVDYLSLLKPVNNEED